MPKVEFIRLAKNVAALRMAQAMIDFSELFSELAAEFVEKLAHHSAGEAKAALRDRLPGDLHSELDELRQDISRQIDDQSEHMLAQFDDSDRDEIIALVDEYSTTLPKLYDDVDLDSLVAYYCLLDADDEKFMAMLQRVEERAYVEPDTAEGEPEQELETS